MRRIFHPIGQGAFYAEIFEEIGFTMVYDCGTFRNKNHGDRIVSQAFTKRDEIDILFISHLDYDHVSEIGKLKNTTKRIKKVILPFMQKNHKEICLKFFKAINSFGVYNDIIALYEDPKNFFGEGTQIIYVTEAEWENRIEYPESVDVDNLGSIIPSGIGISIKNWVFVPYNYRFEERHSKFLQELSKDPVFSKCDFNDTQSILNIINDRRNRTALAKIYKSLDGNINENSLFLYSGPHNKNSEIIIDYVVFYGCIFEEIEHLEHWRHYHLHHMYYDFLHKPGCIYCGDGDLNKVKINYTFSSYMDMVGTIQIPHHGSFHNTDIHQLNSGTICPMSYGTNNPYGHPSYSLISALCENGCIPVSVTEKAHTGFVEIIRFP